MTKLIGCDAHKKYSVFVAVDEQGNYSRAATVGHERERFEQFLRQLPPGCVIALETIGYWYWMVDAMEKAGHTPLLTNAKKAKCMMGGINKTDKLDARGLATLLRNGTLPAVWIADAETRDQRELTRVRMALVRVQTKLKNRVHACFDRYNIAHPENAFDAGRSPALAAALEQVPAETRYSIGEQLAGIAAVQARIERIEARLRQVIRRTPEMKLLDTLPGVGEILSPVIVLEIGDVARFGSAGQMAAYAGLVGRVHSSGGKTRVGKIPHEINHTLRWAFIEAANCALRGRANPRHQHLVRMYDRIAGARPTAASSGKAKVAVARELSQSAFYMLQKKEEYKVPDSSGSCPRPGKREVPLSS